ncbi:formaldehyde-activating enzyme [Streptomyces sp. NPDC048288]|uniref:formaldehyde-activating enzyme n=1 Tax=Streptomyces sp. NPDC048288 TaxID=3365529 RepID=UPI003714ABDA
MPSPFAPTALIGESFVGAGADAAHTNLVIGRKGGPVETAWATALATPSAGHVPFVTVLRPSVPVKPLTLFVTKAAAVGDLHERATWGSAQAGLAQGIADAVADGLIPAADADDLLIVAAVWVNPAVGDLDASFQNQRAAAYGAVRAAVTGTPTVSDVLAAAQEGPANPFYTPTPEVLAR